MNLKILISGLEAIIPKGIDVAANITDSFFKSEKSDATYPLTLNLEHNRHIFGFIERINARSKRHEYPASIYMGPYLILTGRCIVTDITSSGIELVISNDKFSFWADMKEKYLDEIDLGSETYPYHTAMIAAFDESFKLGNKDYIVFPVYQNTEPLIINPVGANDNKFSYSIGVPADRFIPFIRLHKLISKIISALGFTLDKDALLDDTGFKDVTLVCRRNTILRSNNTSSFTYNLFVPHITVTDFISEIERKYSCLFLTSINNKSISILKFSKNTEKTCLPVKDEITKRFIDEDEIVTGIEIKDKDTDDSFVKEYADKLIYKYGDQDSETTQKIECTSIIVGKKTYFNTINSLTLRWVCASINDNVSQSEEYRKKIDTEIRFTVFRPVESRLPVSGIVKFDLFPTATPEPIPECNNDYNLLWKDVYNEDYNVEGLFNRYHRKKYEILFLILEEHTFIVHSDISVLNSLNDILASELIIRNRRYRCFEQEIDMSENEIASHIIKCYPM